MREIANKTLTQLYTTQPAAKDAITNSAGYAVFSDFGFKVIFMGGAGGKGLAVNNATKQETFMEMLEFQPRLGPGGGKVSYCIRFRDAGGVQHLRDLRLGGRGQR